MRAGRLILAAAWLAAAPAWAQVTINNNALDALGKPAPHRSQTRRAPARQPPRKPTAEPAPTPPPAPPTEASKPPAVPTIPPAILALPPPVAVPLAHPPPLPTVPVVADAPGEASEISDGVRVTFGPDRADLNPATVEALRGFARAHVDHALTRINIYAYAAGNPEDPSTPRRLSLERALAARAVLMAAGIPSPRIYPRALGPAGGDTLPDRVDVVTGSATPPAAQSRNAQGPAG